jgi:hypothetical protein
MSGKRTKKARRAREPSRASLREIPEIDLAASRPRPNPHAARIAAEGMIHVRRGRPRKGTETGLTEPRSVRFPKPVWAMLEKRAAARGMSLHAALRTAILEWSERG